MEKAPPNNPVFLQIAYFIVYANILALKAVVDPAEGAVFGGTNLISPQPSYGLLSEQMPEVSKDQIKQNILDVITQFNKAGLTSVYDVGRPPEGDIDLLRDMLEDGPLDLRVWNTLLQSPMRRMQDIGLLWGLGSDGTIVAHFQPFITLGWAVTGKSISGLTLTEETITREEALIVHTRSNAIIHK